MNLPLRMRLCWIATTLVLGATLGCNKTAPGDKPSVGANHATAPVPAEKPALPDRLRSPAKASPPESRLRERQPDPRARAIAKPGISPGLAKIIHQRLSDLLSRRESPTPDPSPIAEPLPDLLRAYADASDENARLDALHGLAGQDDPQAAALLAHAAMNGSPSERVAALELLADHARAEHLPLASAALDATDPDIQAAGLWLLHHLATDAALPVWSRALDHPSVEVTQAAMELLADAPAFLQVPVARLALNRDQPWLTEQALNLLGGLTSKPAVEALIPYLEHPASGDLAQSGLFFLLSEHFDTVEQARAWWLANEKNLGPDLQPLDLQ